MALYSVSADGLAVNNGTVKTFISVTPPSTVGKIRVKRFWVTFDGVNAGATPFLVEVCQSTTDMSGTTTSATPEKYGDSADAASGCTAKTFNASQTENPGTISRSQYFRVPPTTGLVIDYPLGDEPVVRTTNSWRLRITGTAASVNVTCGVVWDE